MVTGKRDWYGACNRVAPVAHKQRSLGVWGVATSGPTESARRGPRACWTHPHHPHLLLREGLWHPHLLL